MGYKVTYKGKRGTTHVVTIKPRRGRGKADVMILKPGDSVSFEELPGALQEDTAVMIEHAGVKVAANKSKGKKH